ncbi:MAG TPA: FdtA/QdtA family cupin domain-containing protein [Thermoanaerobaculia bacterium]|nr:FdtA/QdtA family cupin domain-containing protein [Thermoanaerobaculia bacterium]
MSTTVEDCRIILLPRIQMRQGNITPVHNSREIPFDVARVFYLYDVPGGESRGGHAHRQLQQFIVSVMGAFDVVIDDATTRKRVTLNRAYQGLYVPPMIWAEVVGFSSGAVSLVMASLPYDESDYLRDYDDYIGEKRRSLS